jgi:hypothetical protein
MNVELLLALLIDPQRGGDVEVFDQAAPDAEVLVSLQQFLDELAHDIANLINLEVREAAQLAYTVPPSSAANRAAPTPRSALLL